MPFERRVSSDPSGAEQARAETPQVRLERAYESGQRYLEQVDLNASDLRPHYTEAQIAAYQSGKEIIGGQRERAALESSSGKFSSFQEAVTHYAIGKAGWLGGSYHAARRSSFDDRVNGVDVMAVGEGVGAKGGERVLTTLGIDLTLGESDVVEKIADIAYKAKHHPNSLLYQYLVDHETGLTGSRITPKVAIQYRHDELEQLMAAWDARVTNPALLRESTVPLKVLAQALVESAYLGSVVSPERARGLKAGYAANTALLRASLDAKMRELGKMPRAAAADVAEAIAEAGNVSPNAVKALVCARDDARQPLMRQLLWG